MVEAGLAEGEEFGREVLVPLGGGVKDAGDGDCGRGWRRGLGDDGRGELAVGFLEVERGAIARGEIRNGGDGAGQGDSGGVGLSVVG